VQKGKKTLITLLLLVGCCLAGRAQFDGQWTQYMFNPGLYNPGAVGLNSDLNVHLTFREQWTDVKNAPSTFGLHVGSPLLIGNRVSGIGLLMLNESIGLFRTQWLQLQFAYKKKLWGGALSLGLQGGLLQENFDASGIYIPNSDYHTTADASIPTGAIEGMIPDFSVGAWYNRSQWYAGLSCSHVLGGNINLKQKEGEAETEGTRFNVTRTLYLTGGYNIQLRNPLLSLQPSLLVMSDLVAVQTDLSAIVRYTDKYWGGLDFRPGSALGILVGTTFDFGLSIGYSYDITMTPTSGSHEVFIGYRKKIDTNRFNKKQKSIRIL